MKAYNETPLSESTKVYQRGILWLYLLLNASVSAFAQPNESVCAQEPQRVSQQAAIDFPVAYGLIAARALAWRPDAKLVRADHVFGEIQPDGKSQRWNIEFFSATSGQDLTFVVKKGFLSCRFNSVTRLPYLPDLAPNFVKDAKQVLALAAGHGGSTLIAAGYVPMVQLRTYYPQYIFQSRSTRPVWGVNYLHRFQEKDGEELVEDSDSIFVMMDANTGEFISATTANAWWKFWRK